jgi:FkbM family methyltransferase
MRPQPSGWNGRLPTAPLPEGAVTGHRARVIFMMKQRCRDALRWLIRRAVATQHGLALVNRLHGRLSPALRRRFFYLTFSEDWRVEGRWWVDFAGRKILLPLSPRFPYAWLAATGFHGYDPELHEVYTTLVRSAVPPRVFFDVGAHYGLHSLRMLVHGVTVVSFEPNRACHRFFRECCAANGVTPIIEPVAVGEMPGTLTLSVPGDRSWLGSTMTRVRDAWSTETVRTWTVASVSLDAYASAHGYVPDVIKIDVEGAELEVIRGARELLATARPILIFESWPALEDRIALYELLADLHYVVTPATRAFQRPALSRQAFVECPGMNFVAWNESSAIGAAAVSPQPREAMKSDSVSV